MTTDHDFDPQNVGGALHVLETEFQEELNGEDAAQALSFLRLELHSVVLRARTWAEGHGFAVERIPSAPPSDASAEECLTTLHRLAEALRQLGPVAPKPVGAIEPEKTVREVVQRLRAANAEALLEFGEFEYALREVQHLDGLHGSLRQLHADIAAILVNEENPNGLEALCAVEESSDQASATCEQLVMSFRQICGAVKAWDVVAAEEV